MTMVMWKRAGPTKKYREKERKKRENMEEGVYQWQMEEEEM